MPIMIGDSNSTARVAQIYPSALIPMTWPTPSTSSSPPAQGIPGYGPPNTFGIPVDNVMGMMVGDSGGAARIVQEIMIGDSNNTARRVNDSVERRALGNILFNTGPFGNANPTYTVTTTDHPTNLRFVKIRPYNDNGYFRFSGSGWVANTTGNRRIIIYVNNLPLLTADWTITSNGTVLSNSNVAITQISDGIAVPASGTYVIGFSTSGTATVNTTAGPNGQWSVNMEWFW